MDDVDRTADRAEFDHIANLSKSRKPEGPKPTGYCLNCGETLQPGQRWCDADCLEDWEKNVR